MIVPEVSWAQVLADLVIAIVGSLVAIFGAWKIADWSFGKGIDEERKRRQDEDRTYVRRSLQALLAEMENNHESLLYQQVNRPSGFDLRREASVAALPFLDALPPETKKDIQYASVILDRYNQLKDTGYANEQLHGDALATAMEAVREAKFELAAFLEAPDALDEITSAALPRNQA